MNNLNQELRLANALLTKTTPSGLLSRRTHIKCSKCSKLIVQPALTLLLTGISEQHFIFA